MLIVQLYRRSHTLRTELPTSIAGHPKASQVIGTSRMG